MSMGILGWFGLVCLVIGWKSLFAEQRTWLDVRGMYDLFDLDFMLLIKGSKRGIQ